jgi:hypothetical protein
VELFRLRARIGLIPSLPRQCSPQPTQNPFRSAFKFVLPNSHHLPASASELAAYESVTSPIGRQFPSPEERIVLRFVAAFGTTMPKAAVDEHSDPLPSESKIGTTYNLQMPTPTVNAPTSQQAGQPYFGRKVAPRPNSRHYLRTLFLCKYIRHRRDYAVATSESCFGLNVGKGSTSPVFLRFRALTTSPAIAATNGTTTELPNCL